MHGDRIRPTPAACLRFQASPMWSDMHWSPRTRYWRAWSRAGWNGSSSLVGVTDAAPSAALRIAAAWDANCPFTTSSLVPDARLSVLWKSDAMTLDGVSAFALTSLK